MAGILVADNCGVTGGDIVAVVAVTYGNSRGSILNPLHLRTLARQRPADVDASPNRIIINELDDPQRAE